MEILKIKVTVNKPRDSVWLGLLEFFEIYEKSGDVMKLDCSKDHYLFFAMFSDKHNNDLISNIIVSVKLDSKRKLGEFHTLLVLSLAYHSEFSSTYFRRLVKKKE